MSSTFLALSQGVIALIVGGVVLLVIIMIIAGMYNKLTTLRERFKNAFAQIDVQMKRRYDLIPNLIEVAKGYMAHERDTLEAVISARNSAASGLAAVAADPGSADAIKGLIGAETVLQGAMTKFMAVAEAYPDLKANENMVQLSEELTSTENRIAFSRQAFNDAVTVYNTARKMFPTIIFAGMFGHPTDAELLEFEDAAEIKEAPKVSF